MKKIFILSIMLLMITNNVAAKQSFNQKELVDLANYMMNNSAKVEDWQVTLKEAITREDSKHLVHELQTNFKPNFSEDKNKLKYSFSDALLPEGINVLYNVVIPKQKQYNAELIIVIKGKSWSKEIEKNYRNVLTTSLNAYFTEAVKKFACLTTKGNDIISGDYFLENMTNYFQVQQVKTQFDNVKNSTHKKIIYGYTPLWNQKISVDNTSMNLQIAIKDTGSDYPTYTIGTPILINEY
ncbi:MAG: YwmB family TATA-box binding protein [Bacillota bacterium]|uniref:YwmB family TATA-box binding protein n=1 Tax=Virgibacillus salarius TaxID=447199 RepID=A0A941I8J0_9BACI|nr:MULTISPECIES: YwmB family TATA-box binding protein [Bacillaceae]MBR7795649.1 YwmB family TATA-box binding protein [Virgibacillus salarius]MDY7045641.1 YwmB family TATA-box binding protein [Virgibacillus sp. M23]NAZ08362.1 hypothetical protein [Agaribacter marinus]WBX81885.1 YwmB family TATA-box binding protein [Virgibacillus salarius]